MMLGLGEFSEHVGRQIVGFVGVHSGYGFDERNVMGGRLVVVCGKHMALKEEAEERNKQKSLEMILRLILCWLVKTAESNQKM